MWILHPGDADDGPSPPRLEPGPPDEITIREAISGNLCRCTGYENIVRAIRWAAEHSDAEVTA